MAISPFGTSYAATSLGLSPNVTGGQDIQQVLKTQLVEQVKRLQLRKQRPISTPPIGGGLFNPQTGGF